MDVARRAGVQVINATLPRAEVLGLIQCCDCYVSLHRSEGFGLTMAEAMLMGKPVIATAYSGNIDFMSMQDSLLVGYDLIPLERDYMPYKKGWLWANPHVAEAAEQMRWVYEQADEAKALGERAKLSAGRVLSLEAAGRRMANRLREIHEIRKVPPTSLRLAG